MVSRQLRKEPRQHVVLLGARRLDNGLKLPGVKPQPVALGTGIDKHLRVVADVGFLHLAAADGAAILFLL